MFKRMRMQAMLTLGATIALYAALAWAPRTALAQPASAPAVAAPGDESQPRRGGGAGGLGGPGGPSARPISPEEREEALVFAREHMPTLARLIEENDGNDDRPRRWRLTRFAVERYRQAQRVREQPALYETVLKRLKLQDELFDLARRHEEAPEEERSQIREEMRAKSRELVRGWMQERQARIDNLKRQIEREENQLEIDRREMDRAVNRHMERMMNELRVPGMPDLQGGTDSPSDAPAYPPPSSGPAGSAEPSRPR